MAILCKVSNYSPVAPTQDIVFGNVDEAIALGASGVSMGAMTLGTYQGVQFETIGRRVYAEGYAPDRPCVPQGRERPR